MSKQEKKAVVPALRFPEFRDTREWQLLHGDKIFNQISNKDHNSDLPILAITQEYGAVPREDIDYHVSVTEKSIESYKVVEGGDFIISLRSFQGGIEYSNYKGLCSPAYVILRKRTDVSNYFYKQFFKTSIFIQSMNKNIEGIRDGKMVSYKQFSELLLPCPVPEEQQKIADCLASVDELVTAETQRFDVLKTHKKGLMQQLFPAEGETVPKLRFPEFRGKGEWSETILGKLVKIRSGFSPSKYNLSKKAKYAFLKVEDLNNCVKYQVQSREYSDDTYGLVPVNSVIFPKRGAAIRLNKVRINAQEVLMDTNLMAITPNKNMLVEFLYYKIVSYGLFKIADNSTIPQINNKHINPYPVLIPSKPEQQKIADCLASIDELIIVQAKKVEALKNYKKGLMQELFPAMGEVGA